jgi:tetratricopeptide (TPR) repeat protein
LAGAPADALIYNYLAGISFKQKDDQTAVINLQKAKAADPGYFSPALNLASYFLAKAEYDNAIGEYKSVIEQDVENLKALVGLGLAYELTGQIDSAKSIYEQMLESQRPEAVVLVAQYYFKHNRYEDALVIIDDVLKNTPSYVPLYKIKTIILLQRGQTDEAVNVLEQLEKLEVGSGYPKLISILLKQGHETRAEKIAKNVTASNPEINYGYLLQASIFEYKRQLKRAADVVNRGLSALPEDSGLSLRLGRIHELNNNSPEAIRVYQDLINSKPNYYPGLFSLGALYDRLGNKKEAQSCYQKTIALNDRYVPALNNLAYLYADNYGDKDKALTLSLKAYRLAPEQQDIMDTLGFVLLKNDRADEAAKILEKANLTHSYNPTVSFHLALAYVELKQTGKAIAELEKSLKTGGFPEVEKCRRLLDKLKA